LTRIDSAAVQPLFGQLANAFGRRWIAIFIVVTFSVGSAICGAANNGAALIAGRAVQGVGSGGINMITDVIVSDLIPLRERGNYIAIILAVYSLGTSVGPLLGGVIVEHTTWRWVFLINLPFGGLSTGLLLVFLHVHVRQEKLMDRIKRIDFLGNALIILGTTAVLLGLAYGGSTWPWSSWRTLVSLLLGLCCYLVLFILESTRFSKEPIIPSRLVTNRTAAAVYAITFINSMLLYWVLYFLPVYFQAVLLSTAARAGVQVLPIVLTAVPGAVVAVIVLTRYGRYRPLHHAGFAIATLGTGLFATLSRTSSPAQWVIFQILAGTGSGMVLNTLLPALQAAHPEHDQASATASWAFIRSFGNIWGVAIPTVVFSNRISRSLDGIPDERVRGMLDGGHAYKLGTKAFVGSLPREVRITVQDAYSDALKTVWIVGAAFGVLALLLVNLEREIKLRTELDTEYGLQERPEPRIDRIET
jgi:MFS family permease